MKDRELERTLKALANQRRLLILRYLKKVKEDSVKHADINDSATDEVTNSLEIKLRERYRRLIDKIDHALDKIKKDEYGYCDETGEEIGIKRLIARPVAIFCIEVQEKHEAMERQYSDD